MVKKIFLLVSLAICSNNIYSHCGSCGVGGSADDHAAHEDHSHHDKDKKYDEAAKKKAELLEEGAEKAKEEASDK